MRIGLYPGTFDPVTLGHRDIIRRAIPLVDKLVVAVALNSGKNPLFNIEERVNMMQNEFAGLPGAEKVVVEPFDGLLVHEARKRGAGVIIRGLRAVSDFEFEFQMVGMNREIDPELETVFLMADAKYQAIASRLVKEIARLGGDVTNFVSPFVKEKLLEKYELRE